MNDWQDQWEEDKDELKEMALSIPRDVRKLGWNALYPIIPLVALVIFLICILV